MSRWTACIFVVLLLAGCTPQQRSPDAIREQTAKATHEAAQDTKAAVQGVVQGLREKGPDTGPMDINKATVGDLKSLPGVGDSTAHRIVAGRPYDESSDLVKRHIVTRAEYDRIAGKITAH